MRLSAQIVFALAVMGLLSILGLVSSAYFIYLTDYGKIERDD